jgi:hypothetical protein
VKKKKLDGFWYAQMLISIFAMLCYAMLRTRDRIARSSVLLHVHPYTPCQPFLPSLPSEN